MSKKNIHIATLGAMTVSLAAMGAAQAADQGSPFGMTSLSSGYKVAEMSEGKCGEGKCGAGMMKKDDKMKEGKCGEGKCGGMK